jgi:lysylphosphatidylglycerol synthetase-like protein (DUF2156 family)
VTTTREWRGYWLWIPTAIFIAAVEILGAFGASFIPWTTISTTVGHLETRWHWFALIVVVLITLVVFLGVAYTAPARRQARRLAPAPYSWAAIAYDGCVLVVAVGAGLIAYANGSPKLVRGYWIYGLFILLGIVVPSIYAVVTRRETTFFGTIGSLDRRLPWFRFVLAAGMAVLTLHLALYPWPDVAHQSTRIGGLDSGGAEAVARSAVGSPAGYYEMVDRGSLNGADAWVVTLYPRGGSGRPCVVAVASPGLVQTLVACAAAP